MRSRYCAYLLGLESYLLHTWHPNTRPDTLDLSSDIQTKWLGLTIVRTEQISATEAIVEFVARYKVGGTKAERLHEVSRFEYLDRWYYLDGVHT
ncbi:MAG TPA: YchJ family metal-binding protein [Methylophilus sp.]